MRFLARDASWQDSGCTVESIHVVWSVSPAWHAVQLTLGGWGGRWSRTSSPNRARIDSHARPNRVPHGASIHVACCATHSRCCAGRTCEWSAKYHAKHSWSQPMPSSCSQPESSPSRGRSESIRWSWLSPGIEQSGVSRESTRAFLGERPMEIDSGSILETDRTVLGSRSQLSVTFRPSAARFGYRFGNRIRLESGVESSS